MRHERHNHNARFARNASTTLLLAMALFGSSCAGNGYRKFYTAYLDVHDPAQAGSVEALAEEAAPEVIASSDPNRDVRELIADNYVVLGVSSFVGRWRGESAIRAQGKRVGATRIIRYSQYRDTASGSIDLPSSSTSYGSGTVYSGGQIGSFTTSTTTFDTTPIHYQVRRYSQRAWYLAKSTSRPRVGLVLRDLSEEDRKESGRNAGAAISVVLNDSAAFRSNLVPGDVIVAVDGSDVDDMVEAVAALGRIPSDAASCPITVVRGGSEAVVTVTGL